MENPISISNLNDFIFCPVSIYFHNIEGSTNELMFQETPQLKGTHTHTKIDTGVYSSKTDILQSISVYCEQYDLVGKIDSYDVTRKILTERKRKVTTIYDGYVFQLYAQYFALIEMGYEIEKLQIYSYIDNKIYNISMPYEDRDMLIKFEKLIYQIKNFNFDNFEAKNPAKCQNCIYEPLCCYSCLKE